MKRFIWSRGRWVFLFFSADVWLDLRFRENGEAFLKIPNCLYPIIAIGIEGSPHFFAPPPPPSLSFSLSLSLSYIYLYTLRSMSLQSRSADFPIKRKWWLVLSSEPCWAIFLSSNRFCRLCGKKLPQSKTRVSRLGGNGIRMAMSCIVLAWVSWYYWNVLYRKYWQSFRSV